MKIYSVPHTKGTRGPSSNIGAAKIEKTRRSNDQFKLKSTAKTLHHVVTAIMML